MIDCNSFSESSIQSAVFTTFFGFMVGMSCLCYVDDKLESK